MRKLLLLVGIIAVAGVIVLAWSYFFRQEPASQQPPKPESKTSSQTQPTPSPSAKYFYPINGYQRRLSFRHFGKLVDNNEVKNIPCGAKFVGVHDGDDLETTSLEQYIDVPVYAVTFGTVVSARNVGGYGGLLIVSSELPQGPVTLYYGHVSLSSLAVKTGTKVVPGERLGNLGKGCSGETDNERKHLHFAIHLGTDIDVRGYVQTKTELEKWIDPLSTLTFLEAKEP